MKNTIKLTTVILLVVIISLGAVSCADKVDATGVWENATYRSDTVLGSGANTVKVEIEAEGQSIVLTIKTDKATLGEAMFEHGLVNDPLYSSDTCNGMYIDWAKSKAYWGFYVDGKLAMYGIGDAKAVTTGEPTYKIAYTKY